MSYLLGWIGAITASLLCLVVDRSLSGEPLATVHSRCECGRPLGIIEVLPVVSWFVLRGRARCCGVRLPWRWPAEELGAGLGFFFSTQLGVLAGVGLCVASLGVVGVVEIVAVVRTTKSSGSLPAGAAPRRSRG